MVYPTSPHTTNGAGSATAAIQPPLAGLDGLDAVAELSFTASAAAAAPAAAPAPVVPVPAASAAPVAVAPVPAAHRAGRHRYWSIRDFARRLWYGRGYGLLRELIRSGILPAARTPRAWWIDDADVRGLLAAFDERAGKVRAFRGLDRWLRERCWVMPATPELAASLRTERSGVLWRGTVYLPKASWQAQPSADGRLTYRHQSGMVVPEVEARAA